MASKGLKKVKAGDTRTPINHRFKWVEFTAEDADGEDPDNPYLVRAKVRTSLTQAEIERIADAEKTMDQMKVWEVIAPYVPEWDVIVEDENGDRYEVDAPGISGPEMFKYAPRPLAHALIYAMFQEVFTKVDPKSSTPAVTTVQP